MEKNSSSEEIDLGYLFKKSNDFFKSLIRSFFLAIAFFRRNIIVVIILLILGFAYGYYKDYNKVEIFSNELIVIPNFGSVDYLYDKVEVLNLKLKADDKIYLQKVLGQDYSDLRKIEIEPIADIYNFVSQSRENIDIFRIIADKKDFSEYLTDISTSKYFKYHRMKVSTVGDASERIVTEIIQFFNENEHYKIYQEVNKELKNFEVQEYYGMLSQIDSLLKWNSESRGNASAVEIVNSTDQHYLLERKQKILRDLSLLKMEQSDYSQTIKLVNADYNIKTSRFLSISNKVLYPILFVIGFALVFYIIHLFKRLRIYAYSK